ncbi:aromatic amino acid ammonia-lyase [Streptomyces tricolor]|uniref:aromatic amino acid ammonia-lyase n=1 Tax=Streptomyces tricolor TaxID=68277 RepID=UPI003D731F3E
MDVPTRVAPNAGGTRVLLDGRGLTLPDLVRLADAAAVPAVDPGALDRVRRARETADRLAATGRWYGRGTGVGAHRSVTVDPADETAHGLRLLRSHAGGAGSLLPARTVRAMLAVRANQLLAAGSGIHPSFVTALTEALRLGVHPAVNEYGGVGTGDLTALAQTALTLLGERRWLTGEGALAATAGPDTSGDGPLPGAGEALAPVPAGAGAEAGASGAPAGGTATGARPGPGAGPGSGVGLGSAAGPGWGVGPGSGAGPGPGEGGGPGTGPGGRGSSDEGVPGGGPSGYEAGSGVGGVLRAAAASPGGGRLGGVRTALDAGAAPDRARRGAERATLTAAPGPSAVDGSRAGGPASRGAPGGDRRAGEVPAPVTLRAGDALALLSSNALALAQAALAGHETEVLLRATHAVAALSLAAVSGSPEAYAAPVHALRPYPGPARAAAEVRRLLGLPDRPTAPGPLSSDRRIQDPYGFRAFPQVHGAALDASAALRRIVEVEINCPTENPVLTPDGRLHHHGGFFAAPLALALDGLNLALLKTAQLSAARLSALSRPDLTGLPAFLATGPAGSSGTMILEYTANSALAELRSCAAAPASAGHAVLSHGLEEAAGFAGQAARQTARAGTAYATVLACELVVAVRALRLHRAPPAGPVFSLAASALPADPEDRPLTGDIATATELLPRLAEL